jgi:predicted enzyme related to lactoylglutathione lyase
MSPHFTLGAPCWTDASVPDVDAARAFYSAVMGWSIAPGNPDFGGYTMGMVDEWAAAGIGAIMGDYPPTWTLYFASDDADTTATSITANGGSILQPAVDIADIGRMLIAMDPTGGVFGVWQGRTMPGFGIMGTPGGWAWCDLRSTDPAAAQAFYGAVFGYQYQEMPMAGADYRTFTVGDAPMPSGGIGGMMGAPEGVPSHWLVYFAVADVDAAVAAVVTGGGQSLAAPFDTPFGRMGPIMDPFGAPLWLVQLPAA